MAPASLRPLVPALVGLSLVAGSGQAVPPDPAKLAALIDQRLQAHFQTEGVEPAPRADDAEFLRRLYLDLTGRIPRPADIHAFLADPAPDKRQRMVERLLADPRFPVHFANVWRAELLPEAAANGGAALLRVGFEAWLQQQFRAGKGYDQLVRELLTVPLPREAAQAEPVLRDPERANPLAFFAAKEARPENLAAAVGRTFLGLRLECAQCHDHPFANWKQDQFWNQAAFFAGMERQGRGMFAPLTEAPEKRAVSPMEGRKLLPALFLDGKAPRWQGEVSPRQVLADWITAPDNPYFARATVNRLWGQLFGIGLVDPVDDFRDDNPASAPELLDDLARAFREAQFDLTYVLRAICLSEAYQRTSARTHASQDSTRLPARMPIKAMTGEQFFDSLALATGYRDEQDRGATRRQILTRFALTGALGEPETSVQQALTLLNGRFVAWATNPRDCPTLIAVTQMPGLNPRQKLEMLYLTTLGRKPTAAETERLQRHLATTAGDGPLTDVFWMLLNSAEFRMNH